MRVFELLLLCLVLSCALAFGADTEVNPVRKPPTAKTAEPGVLRLIVKFRDDGAAAAPATKSVATQGPSTSQSQSASEAAAAGQPDASAAAKRAGLVLAESHEIVAGMHAMKVQTLSSGDTLAATLARLRADPTVEYAEPDYRRYVHATPNDPIFQSSQWYLKNDASTPSAIDAVAAWDVTQGADSVIVAIADTGVRFDHPDLKRVSAGGRLLDGYDFITDASAAGDGNGRDADASDPGDWCGGDNSSWHGTRTSGIVGALTNNATGVAGITWHGQILPVRGLGKCGGADSDLIAGVLWAAGVHVAGVPDNPNPAKIINMSFGSAGGCPASWQDAVSQVVARGVLMVVSAGNEGGAVDAPANCAGVAAVAAIRHAGTKVGFSNLGPKVAISAPGGNCVNTNGGPCLYSIDTTSNTGSTSPGDSSYTDQVNFNVGTSFSAPIVAGIAALMASVNSRLDSVQLIRRLQSSAKPFPKSSDTTIADCHVPTGDLQTSECNCTTDTCGAGMANARGAVEEALRPAAVASASPTTASAGQLVNLDGSGSFAANGRSIVSYAWTVVASTGTAPMIANANSANASFNATDGGPVGLRLTVTDDQGAQDSAVVNVNGAVPAITVAVSPGTVSVHAHGGTQSFTASVANTSNTAVTWEVNGVTGGNSTVGTISTAGLYTAPASVPSPATVTVKAVAVADNTRSGTAQVTVTAATTGGGGGGGGGGGAIDNASLLAALLLLLRQRGRCAIRPQR